MSELSLRQLGLLWRIPDEVFVYKILPYVGIIELLKTTSKVSLTLELLAYRTIKRLDKMKYVYDLFLEGKVVDLQKLLELGCLDLSYDGEELYQDFKRSYWQYKKKMLILFQCPGFRVDKNRFLDMKRSKGNKVFLELIESSPIDMLSKCQILNHVMRAEENENYAYEKIWRGPSDQFKYFFSMLQGFKRTGDSISFRVMEKFMIDNCFDRGGSFKFFIGEDLVKSMFCSKHFKNALKESTERISSLYSWKDVMIKSVFPHLCDYPNFSPDSEMLELAIQFAPKDMFIAFLKFTKVHEEYENWEYIISNSLETLQRMGNVYRASNSEFFENLVLLYERYGGRFNVPDPTFNDGLLFKMATKVASKKLLGAVCNEKCYIGKKFVKYFENLLENEEGRNMVLSLLGLDSLHIIFNVRPVVEYYRKNLLLSLRRGFGYGGYGNRVVSVLNLVKDGDYIDFRILEFLVEKMNEEAITSILKKLPKDYFSKHEEELMELCEIFSRSSDAKEVHVFCQLLLFPGLEEELCVKMMKKCMFMFGILVNQLSLYDPIDFTGGPDDGYPLDRFGLGFYRRNVRVKSEKAVTALQAFEFVVTSKAYFSVVFPEVWRSLLALETEINVKSKFLSSVRDAIRWNGSTCTQEDFYIGCEKCRETCVLKWLVYYKFATIDQRALELLSKHNVGYLCQIILDGELEALKSVDFSGVIFCGVARAGEYAAVFKIVKEHLKEEEDGFADQEFGIVDLCHGISKKLRYSLVGMAAQFQVRVEKPINHFEFWDGVREMFGLLFEKDWFRKRAVTDLKSLGNDITIPAGLKTIVSRCCQKYAELDDIVKKWKI